MLFNSWVFLAFLAAVFALYYGVIGRLPWRGMAQVLFLVAASLVFYAYENPSLLFLLGASLLVNGLGTRMLMSEALGQGRRRLVLAGLVTLNLAGIAFFKYASLLANTLLPGTMLEGLLPRLHDIPLPIGISFYTFEGLSIVIDAYQRRVKGFEPFREDLRERKELRFQSRIWLFMTFFRTWLRARSSGRTTSCIRSAPSGCTTSTGRTRPAA
jgi:alginate O-acetyltransferase complex protein AlgI